MSASALDDKTTEMIYGQTNVADRVLHDLKLVAKRLDLCGDSKAPSMILAEKIVHQCCKDLGNKGVEIRQITEIKKENLADCKRMMEFSELRHLDGLKGYFAIADSRMYASYALGEGEKFPPYELRSIAKPFVEQQQYFFDTLWSRAIPAQQRIKDLEEGKEPEFLEVITDGKKVAELAVEFARSVSREALIILPSPLTAVRLERLGVWDYLIEAANHGATIRIISPMTTDNVEVINRITKTSPNILVLSSEPSTVGFFVLDDKKYLRAESKDPYADDLSDATGFVEYSNSKNGIASFRSFFEIIWKQILNYQELQNYSALQKEFISTAAHELKNPVQPIIGLAQVLRDKASDDDRQLLDIIVRNARRLIDMQENILDVTRIESNNLKLNKKSARLKEIVLEAIRGHEGQIRKNKIDFVDGTAADVFINVDRERMVQVISNLISNAIKYTRKGTIAITSIEEDEGESIIIRIRDTGEGIAEEVVPKLFTKYATGSQKGTGLGLFISKSIIEAHGGRIWAENNANGKGATFSIKLPK